MRRSKTRRGITTIAVAGAVASMVGLSTPASHAAGTTVATASSSSLASPAASTVGGPITTSEMASRAQYWVDHAVPYD